MLVSVIIPAFNAESFVNEAVRSVCAQTHADLEVVVVDDGSTDGTASAVRSILDPRIVLVESANQGEPAARNAGIAHAKGDYFAFLDADDVWLPRKLEKQLAVIASDQRVVAIGTLAYYFGRTFKRLGTAGVVLGDDGSDRILEKGFMPFPISTVMTTRAACEAVGGFSVEVPQAPDYGFVLALASRERAVVTVPERLTGYRLHGASLSKRYYEVYRIARYTEYAAAQRQCGQEPMSYLEFSAQFRTTPRELRQLKGRSAIREAGVALFDGEPARLRA